MKTSTKHFSIAVGP